MGHGDVEGQAHLGIAGKCVFSIWVGVEWRIRRRGGGGGGRRVGWRGGGRVAGGGGSEHILPCWGGRGWVGVWNKFHGGGVMIQQNMNVGEKKLDYCCECSNYELRERERTAEQLDGFD